MSEKVQDFLALQAQERPDAPAMSDETGVNLTWRDAAQAATDLADELKAVGVQPRDRVMILCENSVAAVIALFAAWSCDAVAVPINARLTEHEVDRVTTYVSPRAVLLTTEVSNDAVKHAHNLKAKRVTGRFGALHMALPFDSNPDAPDQCAVMLFTTGTTGTPKGVMLSHSNLCFGGRASANLREMTADDVIYGVLPISHVFGLASIVVAAASTGACIRFAARFSEKALFKALGEGITLFSGVPQMHALLMHYAYENGLQDLHGSALRYVSSGAAPLDPEWKRQAEAFYGLPLQNGYGMTETTAGVTITKNDVGSDDISAGPPLPGVEIAIAHSGAADDVGEILTRGPHVMMGYYKNLEDTQKVLDEEGWMHTGDLGRIDASGALHIVGRAKEVIIRGGFNVYPPEVEAAINLHPDVVQCAVLGRPSKGDEDIVAFIQVTTDCTLDHKALHDFLRERLTGYKRPTQLVFSDKLPAAPTGKVLRHRLMTHFAAELNAMQRD